jgi:homoaconitase/3-isopropylmalate dehydratase large subunit
MGSTEADIYLVSPATAGEIAVNGKISSKKTLKEEM